MLNWNSIEQQFQYAEILLDDVHFPEPDEYLRHEAHLLTGGLVRTSFTPGSAQMDLRFLPAPREWADRISELSASIDLQYKKPELRSVIRNAIKFQQMTSAFFDAWSTVQELTGRVIELREAERFTFAQYTRETKSGVATNMLAHKCWFALWLNERNAIGTKIGKEEAQKEIFDLCVASHLGKLKCPRHSEFYDPRWFRRMLRKDGKKVQRADRKIEDLELNGSLDRISTPDLRVLISDPFLDASVLPPLRRADFIEISTAS